MEAWNVMERRERRALLTFAVSEGFEPPIRCRIPVFEAGSFNHSDNSPNTGTYKNPSPIRDCKGSSFFEILP